MPDYPIPSADRAEDERADAVPPLRYAATIAERDNPAVLTVYLAEVARLRQLRREWRREGALALAFGIDFIRQIHQPLWYGLREELRAGV